MSREGPVTLRLDRLLGNLGYGSRRDVQGMVRAGEITLDGEVVASPDTRVEVAPALSQRLRVRGAVLDPPPGVVVALNKPLGVTCSHKDDGPLVYSLLPPRWRGRTPVLSTVGRLDKETSGLLLLTDDGALLHAIISPRKNVSKRYRVGLARPLSGAEAAVFAAGGLVLEGDDKPLAPATLEVLGDRDVWLTVTEGRYHLVRRMFAALGNHVEALHRDRIGGLDLPPDLGPGAYRLLGDGELSKVFSPPGP